MISSLKVHLIVSKNSFYVGNFLQFQQVNFHNCSNCILAIKVFQTVLRPPLSVPSCSVIRLRRYESVSAIVEFDQFWQSLNEIIIMTLANTSKIHFFWHSNKSQCQALALLPREYNSILNGCQQPKLNYQLLKISTRLWLTMLYVHLQCLKRTYILFA